MMERFTPSRAVSRQKQAHSPAWLVLLRRGSRRSMVVVITIIAINAALHLSAGPAVNDLSIGPQTAHSTPVITCTLEHPQSAKISERPLKTWHPEVVIRNRGRIRVSSMSAEVNVYQYNSDIAGITAVARQGMHRIEPLVTGQGRQPSNELRHAALVLSGENVVAVYVVRLNYTAAPSGQPVQLDRLYLVENQNIIDQRQFAADPRYQHIMQAIDDFDKSNYPAASVSGDPRPQEVSEPSEEPASKRLEAADKKSKPSETVWVEPLYVQVNYVYRSGGSGALRAIKNGDALRSGDHYKIYFTANRDCHVYIFQIDAAGQVFKLFPLRAFNGVTLNLKNPVQGGDLVVLPSEDRYFYLDNTIGMETIFFAAAPQQMTDLEALEKRMIAAQQSGDANRLSNVRKAMVAYLESPASNRMTSTQVTPVTWQSGDTTAPVVGYLLEIMGQESIHKLTFDHR